MAKTLTHEERPITKITLIVAVCVLATIGFLGFLMWSVGTSTTDIIYEPVPEPEEITLAEARALAEGAAIEWDSDAVPAQLIPTHELGNETRFRAVYVSPAHEGTGFAVVVSAQGVVQTEEIPYMGRGAAFPANAKTESEAIAEVRAMSGREDIDVLGVEARWDDVNKMWYWGVRTETGTISVKMAK